MHSLTHIKYCHPLTRTYTRRVKLGWLSRTLALAVTAIVVGTGCSGINTQQTINPLMFFLPGIGQTKPVEKQPAAAPKTPTSDVVETASLTHKTGDSMVSVQLN
jgi:hypothetical protein